MIKSFSYMFKENEWWKKVLMLFAFVLASNFLTNLSGILRMIQDQNSVWYYIVLLLGYIIMFVPYGYSMALLKSNMQNKEEAVMPDMDFFQNFKDGFKVVISGMILLILLLVIFSLLLFINNKLVPAIGTVGFTVIFSLIFLIFFVISFLGISMCCRYVIKPNWLNFVNIKEACRLINNNVAKYFKVYLITAGLMIILATVTVLMVRLLTQIGFAGFVLYNILVSVLWTYLTFVMAKLFSFAVDVEKI